MIRNKQFFKAEKKIFREGDHPGNIYLVVSGKVRLVKNCGPNEVVLETISKNGVFGEMSMFDKRPRSATAIACEDTDCYVLNQSEFQECLDNTNPFILGVMRILVDRLRSTTAEYATVRAEIQENKSREVKA